MGSAAHAARRQALYAGGRTCTTSACMPTTPVWPQVMVFGEITTRAKVDYEAVVRKTCKDIGFISDDVGLDADKCKVRRRAGRRSRPLAAGAAQPNLEACTCAACFAGEGWIGEFLYTRIAKGQPLGAGSAPPQPRAPRLHPNP